MANFPHDLAFDVLLRLPVKSVLRFRCVCKSWCSLISEPQFVKTHLNRAISDVDVGSQRILIPHDYKSLKSIDYEVLQLLSEKELEAAVQNNGDTACIVLDLPWGDPRNYVRFSGSCHGMVAFHVDDKIVLCNPCTREFRELPIPTSIKSKNLHCQYINCGLGYDSYVDDYKFVMAVHNYSVGEIKAEVFSLTSNSWKIIQDIPADIVEIFESGVFLNGALHWIASCEPHRIASCETQIVAFNLATEIFQKMLPPLPFDHGDERNSNDYWIINLLGGCLSVSNRSFWKINVWVMKEYGVEASWTKLFTVDEPGTILACDHYVWPVCFSKNGELLVDVDCNEIRTYNPKEDKSRKLFNADWWLKRIIVYGESLVSPNGGIKNK